MKKENLVIKILLVILLISNGFLMYDYFNFKSKLEPKEPHTQVLDTATYHKIYEAAEMSQFMQVNSELILKTSSGDEIPLKDLIKSEPVFVFDFENISCEECFEQEMNRLVDMANEVGNERILFVSSFASSREHMKMEKKYKVKIFNIGENKFDLPVSNEAYPFTFVINPDFKTEAFFFPTVDYFKMGKIYYSIVYNKLFS